MEDAIILVESWLYQIESAHPDNIQSDWNETNRKFANILVENRTKKQLRLVSGTEGGDI